jgi:RimJ/RimL family protein N-acetyltransferase
MATLRLATLEDFPAFQAVYGSIAAEGRWIGAELPIDWDARRPMFESTVADPRYLILLGESDEGEPIAWASAEHDPGGRVSLGMGIVDGHRSSGLGTQLLATIIGWARQRDAHKVLLEVWPHNARAIGLYEKFGFEVEGRHRRHWRRNDGSLWDSLSMGLVLDETAMGGPD